MSVVYRTDAAAYESGRPEYPFGLTDWLIDEFYVDETSVVLDLGAGTGKLIPRIRATGASIIAVEPHEDLLDILKKRFPNVDARQGTAESIPVEDGTIDLVLCGQSFHWFSTKDVVKEIHRVLKPKGALGLVWNTRDSNEAWVRKLNLLLDKYRGDTPTFSSLEWGNMFPGNGFGKIRSCAFPFAHCARPEKSVHDMLRSVHYIHMLPESERKTFFDEVNQIVETIPRVPNTEQIKFPYQTLAFSIEKQ
ncbi:methyltransferase [Schizosaccharomyces japonicus yFS275]|uniref:Methyltransferase n=1 Tax=Schizosaccharomyces japonicus (strain yFS275 / FY16936) TaxID=402676 RepID=B6K2Z4_SCHJY|nr:methyltransferase [Schizosaccharomyces japonicus yFS275]EEB07851.1 methyltransferase [Schizosaccharomyces japonicus yFS275]